MSDRPKPDRVVARRVALVVLLASAGVTHCVRPALYEPLVPRRLGPARPWVIWSGVAELGCAAGVAGLAGARGRRPAALATAALFVGVFPGNLQMAISALRSPSAGAGYRAAGLARLPLQLPLVRWALRVARDSR